jgi:arabinofuranosyltransferase
VDDAYISFRYGKNMMNGYGLVYNPGEYMEGYTNFLWTMVTAPFTKIKNVDISIFTLILGLLISLFNIYFITVISRSFFEKESLSKYKFLLLLPVIFFVLDDSVAFWAIGGMEFPMYTMFVLGVVYNYFRINEDRGTEIKMSIFLMLCTLTRPEGNMIAVITLFHFFVFRRSINNYSRKFIKVIVLYFLFVVVYYGFKYLYYDHFIPNTFYAKGVTDLSMNFWLGFKYLALCMGTRLYVFIFILFIPFKKAIRNFKQSYLLLFSGIYITYLFAVGGDWMIANRFFVPILPALFLLSTLGYINALDRFSILDIGKEEFKKKIINISTVIICALLFAITMSLLEYRELIIKDANYKYELQWSKFGHWLKKNVSPKTVIAVGPAGKIPYYSELYTIDMWGLNNSHIARTSSKRLQAGHKKFDFEYVLSLDPEFIIGYAGFSDSDVPPRYEKFNTPEDEFKSIDVVFRLKNEYRTYNHDK